jgi:hypothetical protein
MAKKIKEVRDPATVDKGDEQQYPQLVHTHPTACWARTPQWEVRYVPESDTHGGQSQGHLQGQYIWNSTSVGHFAGRNTQPCTMQASKACSG